MRSREGFYFFSCFVVIIDELFFLDEEKEFRLTSLDGTHKTRKKIFLPQCTVIPIVKLIFSSVTHHVEQIHFSKGMTVQLGRRIFFSKPCEVVYIGRESLLFLPRDGITSRLETVLFF